MSRYFRQLTKACPVSTTHRRKTQSVCSCSSFLIYPRLISFESNRASGSARQGWRTERCQPWTAVCATHLHVHSQNAAGTRRAELSHKDFWLLFGFWKVTPPEGHAAFGLFKNEGPGRGGGYAIPKVNIGNWQSSLLTKRFSIESGTSIKWSRKYRQILRKTCTPDTQKA